MLAAIAPSSGLITAAHVSSQLVSSARIICRSRFQ